MVLAIVLYTAIARRAKSVEEPSPNARLLEAVSLSLRGPEAQAAAPPLHQLMAPSTKTTTIASLTTVLYITLYRPMTLT